MIKTFIWVFTLLAFVFLFFSLRSKENEVMYTFIALGMWGVAFLLNRFKKNKEKEET
ncbi:MAG: hypothetical protein AAF551_12705 [Bacteroidota bacterium]